MYISILFDFKLLQGFLELPEFMPKTSNKDGTMDSLIYPSHSRLKLDSHALVISIASEHQEKCFKISRFYHIKWHVHLPWIPQKSLVTNRQFCWQQCIFKEDTWLRVQGIGVSLSVGFCFQMKSPTLRIVSWPLSLIAASSRSFRDS